jgi:CHAD domain-containing protein
MLAMHVTNDGKWFWVDPPTAPVAHAAEQILALRMVEVERHLPLAARHAADDIEYVHQLRVNCRRAAAALRAFESLVGKESFRLKKWLKRLREAAGPARDADVLIARLHNELDPANPLAQQLVDTVVQSRKESQDALARIDRKATDGALQKVADRCIERLATSNRKRARQSFAKFSRRAVGEAARGLEGVDVATASLHDLHQLRIAAKRLRYAIEIFHSAASPALRLEVYPQVEELQERLGALNDRASSQARWQTWLADLPPNDLAAFAASLVVRDHAAATERREEFLAWWTPERQASVRDLLDAAFA